jgi:hypothetical protein
MKKFLKPIIAIVLCCTLALSSCGKPADDTAGTESEAATTTTAATTAATTTAATTTAAPEPEAAPAIAAAPKLPTADLAEIFKQSEAYKDGVTIDYDINYEASEMIAALLGMSTIDLTSRIAADPTGKIGFDLSLIDGDEKLTMAAVVDEAQRMIVSFPGLTKYSIATSLDTGATMNTLTASLDAELLLADVQAVIEKFYEIYNAKGITPDDFTFVVGELTKEVKRYTAEFSERDAIEFALFMLETIRANENLMTYLEEVSAYSAYSNSADSATESFSAQLDDIINEGKTELADLDGDGTTVLKIENYILNDETVGMKITMPDEDIEIKFGVIEDGNTGSVVFDAEVDGTELALEADYTKNGEKYTGEGKITIDSVILNAEFKDLEISADGYGAGLLTLSMDAAGTGAVIDIDMSYAGTTQTMVITGEITSDGETIDIGKLTLDMTLNPFNASDIPEVSEEFLIDGDDPNISDETYAALGTDVMANMANFESPLILSVLQLIVGEI